FFRTFCRGSKDKNAVDFILRCSFGERVSGFYEMIPELINPSLGGAEDGINGSTQAVGCYLRAKGVSGVIYPSARQDSFAVFTNEQLTRWGGWNFVDYRTSSRAVRIKGAPV